jgi:hypothetical protein
MIPQDATFEDPGSDGSLCFPDHGLHTYAALCGTHPIHSIVNGHNIVRQALLNVQ